MYIPGHCAIEPFFHMLIIGWILHSDPFLRIEFEICMNIASNSF